jgi:alpha-L-fucosidase
MNSAALRATYPLLAALLALAAPLSAAPKTDELGGVTVDTSGPAATPAAAETSAQRDARMAWWRDAKFGLFIHWGVYSVPARRGEWLMRMETVPVATYRDFAKDFTAAHYDPSAWAALAKDAGMKYLVITAKHHDGFALYDSAVTDWDAGRDLLGPLASAVRAEGLKFGLYYSHAQDWTHPGGAKSGYKPGDGWDPAHKGDFDTYLREIAVPQTREIITCYQPDILWWDTPSDMNAARAKPFADLLALRPGIITNNRLGGGYPGDTHTPEQFVPVTGYPGDWETCMTIGRNWGYTATDTDYKSTATLVRKLAEIASKGGNFLLNVGPRPDGVIPEGFAERLRGVGAWLRVNGDSIYGTKAGPFAYLSYGYSTRKQDRLYLQVFDWPADGKLPVPLLSGVRSASLLSSPEKPLALSREPGRLVVAVPSAAPDPLASVLVLELDGEPVVRPLPTVGAVATSTQTPADTGKVFDGTGAARWRAPADVRDAVLEIALTAPDTLAAVGLDEPDVWPRMKQTYKLEALVGDTWTVLAEGKTDGHGVKKAFAPVITQKLRLSLNCEKGAPGVAELQLYRPE